MSTRARNRLAGLGVGVVAYVVLFWVVGFADYLILHPTTNPIAVKDARHELIAYDGAHRLEYWIAPTRVRSTQENLAYVLEFSPNAGRAEYALLYGIGKWEGLPIEYWTVNYPGYGQSEGPCTLDNIQRTALTAYDELKKVAGDKPIFLSGYSLGTAAALHVAANRPVAGLFLVNPPPLRQLIRGKWWYLFPIAIPVAAGVPAELDSIANGQRASAPAVFVLGQRDTFVEYPYQQKVAAAYAGEKRLLPLPINHNDDPEELHRKEIRNAVLWLWEKGVPQPPATQP